jgi:hypothetical protein
MNARRDTSHVFVREQHTALLLTGDGYWTSDETSAHDFGTTAQAIAHCLAHKIFDAQIVVLSHTSGQRCTTVLRLPKQSAL